MKFLVIAAAFLATVSAQYGPADMDYQPIPYSFNYLSDTEDGGSSEHQESGDGSGTVHGSYTVNNLEGHTRVVEYEAGPEGFKAFIRTNEPGTENSNPADVVMESTASDDRGHVSGYNNVATSRYTSPPARNAVTGGQRQNANVRYVLVPSTDPRARGQY